MGYFESQQIEALPAQIHTYFATIILGFGEKFGQMVFAFSSLFGGLLVAFIRGPVFAAYSVCYSPFFFLIIIAFGNIVKKATMAKAVEIKILGGQTEETLCALKLI